MPHKHPPKHCEGLEATTITLAGLLILLVLGLAFPPRSSAGGNAKGKIAFARGSGASQEIYVMNADGSAQTRVTNNAVEDYFPVISPNGAKIAFESVRDGNRDIYVIDPDGTNEQRLTTTPGVDFHAAWSPDGKQIAWSSDQNGNQDIYVMDADGSNQTRITIHAGTDFHPVYSLDGTRFVFASVRDGEPNNDREIFMMAAAPESDMNQALKLTDNLAFDSFPAWSPDGTKILFHSGRDGNNEIYVMDVNGGNPTNLTRTSTRDVFPNWSPDGTKIVFESSRGGNTNIYVMDADGNNQTRLTTDAGPDQIPSWHWERPPAGTLKAISGRVLGVDGAAVGNLKINVRRIVDAGANCIAGDTFERTSPDGTYSIQVMSGCSYRVEPDPQELLDRFGSTGRARPDFVNVFVAFDVPAINFAVGATPSPAITGRIIDDLKCPNYDPGVDGNRECGLPDVAVTGEWSGETRRDVSKPIPINADPTISGKYTLPQFLTNSVVTVRAVRPGYVITIIPPNTEQIDLDSATRPLVDFKAVLANNGPAVSLTEPANGTTYPAATPVLINANASDEDGMISKVEFFQGNTKLGEDNSGPYSFTWNPLAAGNYSLTAVATDNGGTSTTSSPVNITVNEPAIQFSSATYDVAEDGVTASLMVSRSGDASDPATVNFTTGDAASVVDCSVPNTSAASSRCDYETTIGTLRFAASETSKTISIPIIDDSYAEGNESFTVTLSNATGPTLGSPSTATVTITDNDTVNGTNPIGQVGFFVRLQYIDFLNREPDAGGLDFWTSQITSCGSDPGCIDVRRINVSSAFFLSIEFQQTGYFVHRLYKATFTDSPVRPRGLPRVTEFLSDTREVGTGVVIGQPGAEQQLEQNQQEFARRWVQRAEVLAQLPADMAAAQFVDRLFQNSEVASTQPERDAAIAAFGAGGVDGRAAALRSVADSRSVYNKQYNPAFVLLQYVGYLRRNPNDAPDLTYAGYDFWLTKLNGFSDFSRDVRDETEALGRASRAEMVKSFIVSEEYRKRFGPP